MNTVRVIYHHESGGWWAEAPEVGRWYAVGDTFSEVRRLAVDGIPFTLGYEPKLEHCVPADEQAAV